MKRRVLFLILIVCASVVIHNRCSDNGTKNTADTVKDAGKTKDIDTVKGTGTVKETVETVADEITGHRAVKQGQRMKQKIRQIYDQHEKQLEEFESGK